MLVLVDLLKYIGLIIAILLGIAIIESILETMYFHFKKFKLRKEIDFKINVAFEKLKEELENASKDEENEEE